MRTIRVFALTVAVAGVVMSVGCASALAAPEEVKLEVSYYTYRSATLFGVLNPKGGGKGGTYEFLYKEGAACAGEGARVAAAGITPGFPGEKLTAKLANLEGGVEYTACLLVHNLVGETTESAPVTFTTPSPSELPEAPEAKPAGETSNSTAALEGVLNPHSAIPIRWFFRYAKGLSCLGSEEAATTSLQPPSEVSIGGEESPLFEAKPVSVSVSGLKRDTQYTYCLVAVNGEEEESSSAPVSFTTSAVGPTTGEESFSAVGSSSAVLQATVDSHGTPTSYDFEYGTSTGYGTSTPLESAGAGANAVDVQANVSGLEPATLYHFRLVAINEDGETVAGADATFSTYPSETPALPDGRGYEAVSSLQNPNGFAFAPSEGGGPGANGYGFYTRLPFRAAAGGEALAYVGGSAPEGGNGAVKVEEGVQYLARRDPSGWLSGPVQPSGFQSPEYESFSSDLTTGIFDSSEALTLGVPNGYSVPYSYSTNDGQVTPLFQVTPPNREPFQFRSSLVTEGGEGEGLVTRAVAFAGASSDMSHLLFEANDALTTQAEQAPPGEEENDLYDSVQGQLHLVNVLDGKPVPNATFGYSLPPLYGPIQPNFDHVISEDGSRIFWTDLNTGTLYVRENDTATEERCAIPQPTGAACTVQVSQGSFPAQYLTATPDGSYVIYSEGGLLDRFDVATGARETLVSQAYSATGSGEVTAGSREVTSVVSVGGSFVEDEPIYGPGITIGTHIQRITNSGAIELSQPAFATGAGVPLAAGGADAEGILGASEDLSYIYFASGGALSGNATTQSCEAIVGGSDLCNIYALRVGEGGPRLVATVSASDGEGRDTENSGPRKGDWQPDIGDRTAFVTPDGLHLVFRSDMQLTSSPAEEGRREIYMYDFPSGALTCVSCNPRGTPEFVGIEGGGELETSFSNTFATRDVSTDGDRVFFNTNEALVPQDHNSKLDVYEWERDGTGSCTHSPGCVYLLSAGTSGDNSYFLDASENGNDVFIGSRADLVPQDRGEAFQVFDVRVGAAQPPATTACTGTGCQGVPAAPPPFATPPTVTADGPGNPVPPVLAPKPKPQTRAQKLAEALKTCRTKHDRKKRAACEGHARAKYGVRAKKSHKKASNDRRASQ
jgi:hypothetical protein